MQPHAQTVLTDGLPSRGNVREVALLAFPVVLTQLSTATMGVIDSAMVGRLGAAELGGVGFGGILLWTTLCFFLGSATGVQTFVSQADGAGRRTECGPWAWQGLYALLPLMALATGVLLLVLPTFIAFLGPSEELQGHTVAYMQTRLLGSVGLTGAMVFTSFFRGLGDTRTPLYATLVANVVNAVLDYGLIFGRLGLPEWGVAGAGAATAVAEWIYGGIMLAAFCWRRLAREAGNPRVPPHWAQVRRLMRTGAPIGGQWFLEMTSFAVFSTLVARMGDASMAASQAFLALLSLSFLQVVGVSIAASTLVGRYVGANDPAAVERSFRSSLKLGFVFAGVIAVIFVSIPGLLLRIFTNDPEVLAVGSSLVMLGAVFQLFDAVAIVSSGSLRGAGDTRWPLVVQTLLAWGIFLPLGWLLGVKLGGGVQGAWLGGTFYVLILSAALTWRFHSGAWRKIRI